MLVGPVIFPLVAFPLVILPSMVIFVMLVMLVSGVLMFCAFTEFKPTIASMPNIAARIGMIKTNCFLIASISVLLTYKGLEVIILCVKYQMPSVKLVSRIRETIQLGEHFQLLTDSVLNNV